MIPIFQPSTKLWSPEGDTIGKTGPIRRSRGLGTILLSFFKLCWPEKTQLLVLSSCLKGSARTFYIGLPQEDK
ncbi:hypothetical protein DPMN_085027 [Dreissena polymorpha]|uniref:Uncharacterized protein n=1 Tax=Dreissena polymorpha TaxID=45954 RepID=A0A9D4BJ21_DREPO|nr:hypothetical protein DPMN_085027 [Dreissena polymorpha]